MKTKALIPALAVALLLVGAATAQAKWSYGNGESDLEVGTAPTSIGFVCTPRIHGRAGLGTTNDPAVKPEKAAIMISAAAVMIRPVCSSP